MTFLRAPEPRRRMLFAAVRCPRCKMPFPQKRYLTPRLALERHLEAEHRKSHAFERERAGLDDLEGQP